MTATAAERAAALVRVAAVHGLTKDAVVLVGSVGQVESQIFSTMGAECNAASLRRDVVAMLEAHAAEAVAATAERDAAAIAIERSAARVAAGGDLIEDIAAAIREAVADAEAERDAALAEVARLRVALLPFANSCCFAEATERGGFRDDDDAIGYRGLTVGHFRAARDVLGDARFAMADENARLRGVVEDFAEADCEYGDGCPAFGSRHYACVGCRARKALDAARGTK